MKELSNKRFSIVYMSPGWPPNKFSNGIVRYIDNIICGFGQSAESYVVTHNVVGYVNSNHVIDLSKYSEKKHLKYKILNKFYKLFYMHKKLIEMHCIETSKEIIKGLTCLEEYPDLIEIEESFGVGKYLFDNTDIPIVVRLHGPWAILGPVYGAEKEAGFQARVFAEGRAIRCCHGVTCPSQDALDRVRDYYDCDLANARVIPNPISPVGEKLQWRYLGRKQSILFVGRFDRIKGGDIVLEAFRIIAQKNKDAELLFAGPDIGVPVDGRLLSFNEYIETFIPEASIKERISYMGNCDGEQIANLRRNATVTIATSRYENFPLSLLEALATGTPVVSVSVGGIKEMIINDYNGVLAVPNSPESIADKVEILLNDPNKMKEISRNAIKWSLEKYHPAVIAEQSLEYYKHVSNIYG